MAKKEDRVVVDMACTECRERAGKSRKASDRQKASAMTRRTRLSGEAGVSRA